MVRGATNLTPALVAGTDKKAGASEEFDKGGVRSGRVGAEEGRERNEGECGDSGRANKGGKQGGFHGGRPAGDEREARRDGGAGMDELVEDVRRRGVRGVRAGCRREVGRHARDGVREQDACRQPGQTGQQRGWRVCGSRDRVQEVEYNEVGEEIGEDHDGARDGQAFGQPSPVPVVLRFRLQGGRA